MTSHPVRTARHAAFTIIELLTVMTIILLLAALVLGLAGTAQRKAAESRARGEIQALSTAATAYQADNGIYPRVTHTTDGTNNTDDLNAQKRWDPADSVTPTYSATSKILYQLLSGAFYVDPSTGKPLVWAVGSPVTKPTVYFQFKDSQLKNTGNVTTGYIDPATVSGIVDPFGLSYGYSTAFQANTDAVNGGAAGTSPPPGYNPTYDLWSTAGYSPTGGKAYPTDITAANTQNTLWIKNW